MHAKITKTQILSKIDPGGALEPSWESHLKQGASKTSFLKIWLHSGTPLEPVWADVGHRSFDAF